MITKPNDWETAESYTGEGGPKMTPGGHICRIVGMRQENSKRTNRPMIIVAFDVDEGGVLDGFYMASLRERKKQNPSATWQGVIRFMLYGKDGVSTNPYFKGFIKSLEESNHGYQWNWDERGAVQKKIGIVMREEEYRAQDGNVRVSVKAWQARSVQAILDGVPVPEKKKLNDDRPAQPFDPAAGFTAVDDDELPF